jgi:hypothetical protein
MPKIINLFTLAGAIWSRSTIEKHLPKLPLSFSTGFSTFLLKKATNGTNESVASEPCVCPLDGDRMRQ